MDSVLFPLLSNDTPLLPVPWLARVYLGVAWGIVLGYGLTRLLSRVGMRWAWPGRVLPGLVLLACLWPGPASPAWWLGLAFRAPSALTVTLCLWFWLDESRSGQVVVPRVPGWGWPLALSMLGWVLLLDTFALWPASVYAMGFAPWMTGALALLASLPWMMDGGRDAARRWAVWLVCALALHGVLRLPSGNAWDAVIDPWLWVVLQVVLLRGLMDRRWQSASPATGS